MDKKMLKYVFIIIGMVAVMIILLLIKNSVKKTTATTFVDLEKRVVEATKSYSKKYPGALPSLEGTSTTISISTLVEQGYIKELSSYIKEDVTCSGTVEIHKSVFGEYDYSPNITCGTKYATQKLSEKVIYDNDGDGVLSGMGLYKMVNDKFVTTMGPQPSGNSKVEYYFRGDVVNNYVKIGDNLWRIVGIDNDYNVILIYHKTFRRAFVWDNRYNEDVKKSHGINLYESNGINSRILDTLGTFFDDDVELADKEKLSPIVKSIIMPMDVCMGSRNMDDTDKTGKSECKTILKDQYISLLPAYIFMNASLDENCKTIKDKSCGNYNYLAAFGDDWWLLTASSANTTDVYYVTNKHVEPVISSAKTLVKPVVKISSRVLYSEGDGSLENPYTIKNYK